MNIIKSCIFLTIFLVSSVNATETLRVAFVFNNIESSNYSYSERKSISNNFISELKKSFLNSDLSSRISFTKVYHSKKGFASSSESLNQVISRYRNDKSTKTSTNDLVLQKVQKDYNADIVVGIMDASFLDSCGVVVMRPKNISEIYDGNSAILLINNESWCMSDKRLIAHEVGHTLGLWHGKEVKEESGYLDDYNPSNMLHYLGAGYGDSPWTGYYSTIMAKYLTNASLIEKNKDNKFSRVGLYECGYSDNDTCGDSNSSAYHVLDYYAPYYNNRGNW